MEIYKSGKSIRKYLLISVVRNFFNLRIFKNCMALYKFIKIYHTRVTSLREIDIRKNVGKKTPPIPDGS